MSKESIEKTAFITQDDLYEYISTPFGFCNAGAVFQRAMDKVQGHLRFNKVLVYLDDILFATETTAKNLEILREVLQKLDNHNLTLRLKKYVFFLQTEIDYLGHMITSEGIHPSKKKTKAVLNFLTPTNVHTLRQFLGLTGYFRKFIQNYALISSIDRTLTQRYLLVLDEHPRRSNSTTERIAN